MESLEHLFNSYNPIGTCTSLTEKMETLKRKCETLCSREADIIAQLHHAESSSRKKRRNEVEDWLVNVVRTRNGVQSIELQVSRSGLLGRKQLVKRVKDLIKEVAELMKQGVFREGLVLDAQDETKEKTFLVTKLVGQAFQRNLEIIWEHLRTVEVLIIGVWGMGGIGKTTLVTHIHNQVQEDHDNTFNQIYWVTVSQNSSIRQLQDDIAKAIHFDISFEEDKRKRAALLSGALRRKERSLLILDDVWNDICLEKVGVPVLVNGCKLIITTRSLEVCRMLDCDEKIKVQPLGEEEAWDLFSYNLKNHRVALSPQVLEVAKCVARECAGLPLGIVVVARCMRGVDDICEWRDALRALKESKVGLIKMEEEVFQVLKFSYSRLNNSEVQQCFLYCALYPEDFEIHREVLIQCLVDEGLIKRMKNRQDEFDKGHAMLNKLVNSCLLEAVGSNLLFVKMHDLLRDMAIMMSPRFMVKAGMQLREMPDERDFSEDVEKVSLVKNNIEEIALGSSLRCPKLLSLLLSENRSLKRIEHLFFKHMLALEVLDLSFCEEIEELPDSISNMKNLSALVLHGCGKLQDVPSLAELKSLKRLDLWGTGIRVVPHGLERLVYLTYLDLTSCLKVFPTGILPKLYRLEYLKFDSLGYENSVTVKIKGEELTELQRLSTFEGHVIFDDVNGFNSYLMSRKQYRGSNCSYYFALDDGKKHVEESYRSHQNHQNVSIEKWRIHKRGAWEKEVNVDVLALEVLLRDVQSLEIYSCIVARNLSDVPTRNLKRCHISDCEGIECLGSFSSPPFLQTLEILELHDLDNLCVLFELEGKGEVGGEVAILLPPAAGTVFSCLKKFILWDCPKIKKLFHHGFLANLQNLQEVSIIDCHGLEEILASEPEEASNSSIHCSNVCYTLPNLRSLELRYLPELKSICAETIWCGSLRELIVTECPKLKRIPLSTPPSCTCSIS